MELRGERLCRHPTRASPLRFGMRCHWLRILTDDAACVEATFRHVIVLANMPLRVLAINSSNPAAAVLAHAPVCY